MELVMRPRFIWLQRAWVLTSALAIGGAALAHGPHRGYWRYDPWVAPLVVGTAIGKAVDLSRPYPPAPPPTVVVTPPPLVIVHTPATVAHAGYTAYTTATVSPPVPLVEAYYCREATQYYPVVQTCPSPWMLIRNP